MRFLKLIKPNTEKLVLKICILFIILALFLFIIYRTDVIVRVELSKPKDIPESFKMMIYFDYGEGFSISNFLFFNRVDDDGFFYEVRIRKRIIDELAKIRLDLNEFQSGDVLIENISIKKPFMHEIPITPSQFKEQVLLTFVALNVTEDDKLLLSTSEGYMHIVLNPEMFGFTRRLPDVDFVIATLVITLLSLLVVLPIRKKQVDALKAFLNEDSEHMSSPL